MSASLPADHPFRGMTTEELDADHRRRTRAGVEAHHAAADRALAQVERLTAVQRRRAAAFTCRCPKGCVLITVYPRRPPWGGEGVLLLIVAQTRRTRRARFAAWPVADDGLDPDRWLPIGCAHGQGKFDRELPHDLLEEHALPSGSVRRITDLPALVPAARVLWESTE